MTNPRTLFGTDEPQVAAQPFTCGPWSMLFENGALRYVSLHGAEAIRSIAFLVRDRDWGTLVPNISNTEITQTESDLQVSFDAAFSNGASRLDVKITIKINADQLQMTAFGHVTGDFETNRAGFTVLHPINGVAGYPVSITHSDGTNEDSHFPELIAPWQPFMDITALTHHVADAAVTCAFEGDTFEMEDQRQWGDASFKTYNRPLARPWPYVISQDAALHQSVRLTWKPRASTVVAKPNPPASKATFPQMALVITPDDARRLFASPKDVSYIRPQRLLCHLDVTLGKAQAQFAAFAAAQRACPDQAFDLELICRCDADPQPELEDLAMHMRDSGFEPASILVCPSVDRQSTPPGSQWPACPPLKDVHAAAAKAFPHSLRGGGMVSFFPELNRKRPPVEMLDFVGHGLCPIVHAADDMSVMETLQAIPHITRSARAIIGDKAYRIGPATLAMRQNPYGARTIPNPDQNRVCMSDDDPRHRAAFGAAYAMGLATALAPADIAVWTPAALYGPRGVIADNGQWPIAKVLRDLAGCAGQPVRSAVIKDGMARLSVGDRRFSVNLTAVQNANLAPFEWASTVQDANA